MTYLVLCYYYPEALDSRSPTRNAYVHSKFDWLNLEVRTKHLAGLQRDHSTVKLAVTGTVPCCSRAFFSVRIGSSIFEARADLEYSESCVPLVPVNAQLRRLAASFS